MLTPKQDMFVREYLIDLNATQAAIRAGYSARTAHSQGERLLRHVGVAKAVRAAQAKRAERVQITADEVLRNIRRIGQKAEGVKRWDAALKAQELLGKHLKLFTERIEVDGLAEVAQAMAAALKRKRG